MISDLFSRPNFNDKMNLDHYFYLYIDLYIAIHKDFSRARSLGTGVSIEYYGRCGDPRQQPKFLPYFQPQIEYNVLQDIIVLSTTDRVQCTLGYIFYFQPQIEYNVFKDIYIATINHKQSTMYFRIYIFFFMIFQTQIRTIHFRIFDVLFM